MLAAEDDQQVADHGGLALFVQLDGALLLEHLQRHVHHADGAFDDFAPRRDDGAGLLAPQHRGGDFLRVSQVTDSRFQHLHAGLRQPRLNFTLELLGHLERVAAQAHLPFLVRVVGVLRRQVAQGRFGLHVDVVVVVIHLERRLGGIYDAPHDDGRNFYRAAVVIVHLKPGLSLHSD